ncbi:MAG: hypothetical protein P1U63_04925 [Coxiellaceae bacterium]|nr:hypothetical protein [Coxiellaceae bacterium]
MTRRVAVKLDCEFTEADLRRRPERRAVHFGDAIIQRVNRQHGFAIKAAGTCFLYAVATHIALNAVLFGNAANLTTLPAVGNAAFRTMLFAISVKGILRWNDQDKYVRQSYYDKWLPTERAVIKPQMFNQELKQEQRTFIAITAAVLSLPAVMQFACLPASISLLEKISVTLISSLFVANHLFDTADQQSKQLRAATMLSMPEVPVHRP